MKNIEDYLRRADSELREAKRLTGVGCRSAFSHYKAAEACVSFASSLALDVEDEGSRYAFRQRIRDLRRKLNNR